MNVEKSIISALQNIDTPNEITLILSDRTGVEPEAPYLLINVVNKTKIGLPRKTVVYEQNKKTESLFQTVDYLVSFILHAKSKDDSHEWFHHFYRGLDSDFYDYAFSQSGLGIVGAENIMYQPNPVDGINYKRAIMNITFRTEILDEFFVNSISRVRHEGDLSQVDVGFVDDVIVDINFEG